MSAGSRATELPVWTAAVGWQILLLTPTRTIESGRSRSTPNPALSTLLTLLSMVLTLSPTQQLTVTATAHQLSASSSTIPQSSTIPARLILQQLTPTKPTTAAH